jgi:hypothetical protein
MSAASISAEPRTTKLSPGGPADGSEIGVGYDLSTAPKQALAARTFLPKE